MSTNVYIFGAGEGGRQVRARLSSAARLKAFLDNDNAKHGGSLDGVPVASPEVLRTADFDYVIIGSMYVEEIMEQLLQMDVPRHKIIHASDNNPRELPFPWDAACFATLMLFGGLALIGFTLSWIF